MWKDDGGPPTRRDFADLGGAVLRLLWQLVQLAGNVAFLGLQLFLAFMLGFGSMIAGLAGASRRRK